MAVSVQRNLSSSGSLRAWLFTLLLSAVIGIACNVGAAATVVAVLSSDAGPYREAQASLERVVSAKGHRVQTVLLADVSSGTLPKADIVVAVGSDAAIWVHEHTSTQPVYYCMVPNGTDSGLNKGRTCRGVTTDVPLADQFALIADVLPKAHVVGMLYHSDTTDGRATKEQVQNSLPKDWKLEAVAVNEFDSKAKAIDELLSRKLDVVWTSPDPAIYDVATLRSVLLAALRRTVPVYGFSQALVRSGGLMGISIDPKSQGARVAELILGDMATSNGNLTSITTPVAQAPDHQIIVNLIVASKLDITIPDAVVQHAAVAFKNE